MAILITNKFSKYINLTASSVNSILTWGQSIPARFWGTETPEYWGGIDAQAQAHYNRVIADGGVLPSGLGGVNSFFQVVKEIYGTSDINTAISVGLDPQYLGYKLGAGSGTTLGQAAQKLYSCSGASGDVVQTTAASQPLLLVHSGASTDNYWYSPQINSNFCTAPNITIPTASGFEMDVKVAFTTNDDSINTSGWFASHDSGSSPNRNIFFGFSGTRTLTLYLNNLLLQATATTQFPASFSGWLRVNATTVSANMEVKYYTSTDGITFTQLGTTITLIGGANCIKTTAIKFDITGNNGANTIAGKYFRAIYKDANGVTRADFNPSSYNPATSQTQWTSATGEVWTINTGTATTGYKGQLVTKTIVMGDAVDDFISVTGLTSRQYFTRYVACIPYTNPNTAPRIISGNADTHLIFKTAAGAFEAFNGLQLAFTGELVNILQALIVDYNSTNSKTFVNNAGETSGSTGTTSSTAVSLFGSVTGTTLSNAVINTVIQPISVDNATTRTAVYNYIKSINGNSF